MHIQALTITATEGPRTVDGALRALRAISGVAEAARTSRAGVVTIRFDQEQTSLQELRAALIAAGYDTLAMPVSIGGESSCCGSCGG